MKTNKFITSIIIVTLWSCEKSIDVDFPNTQIDVTQVFETVSTADGALSNLYAEMYSFSVLNGGTAGSGALLGSYTDDLNCYMAASLGGAPDIFNNQQLSSNSVIKNSWANSYKQIYLANSIIIGVDASSGIATKDKNRIKGEALFLRSLIYFYLTQIFGDVPYTTTTDFTINQKIGKMNDEEVLTTIHNDLMLSIDLLEDNYRNTDRIYPNKKAAEMMLAIVCMQENKWSQAENLLEDIKSNSLYAWEPDVSKTFKKSGKHILWQFKPLQADLPTNEASIYYFTTAAPTGYALSNDLVNSFETTDLRLQKWITKITVNQNVFYRCNKYVNAVNNPDEYSIVFRMEEVNLLLAEALVRQNRKEEALPLLNAVRQKAGNSNLGLLSNEQFLEELLNENRREFFAEKGNRFLTLKRFGRLDQLNAVKTNWQNFHKVWPIPLNDLLLNPNLNPQNPGY
ncbi:RagB/SusD family nutrient uptake outer membrane protein [Chryseobacterium tructae]|uniref:RagB/SusD family nutrient uptake outer membrane protein n=1 Tax=Chryseobacterium tructae TaxID=1037380 RepID=A0ABV7Y003_9FLAO|nr:RagB/SusD family nutrient uptake outer membrane protein [Chryseobacterium tructae]MDN3694257.1 RagB/SusD family nutrient uptake outer membrane protein [Chryseobacterium tructae]